MIYQPHVLPLRTSIYDDSGRLSRPWVEFLQTVGRKAGRAITWMGDWSESQTYAVCDVVRLPDQSLWLAKQAQPFNGAATKPGTEDAKDAADRVWELILHGIPAGGTTGQVLAKHSGTDYDVEWIAATGGGTGAGGFELLVNGDLIDAGITVNAP